MRQAMTLLVARGMSWSGREKNCVFLNCGDSQPQPQFANISAATGLNFPDDGRGLAVVDWDHDGDLDMWLRNRNGPRLRLMLNGTHAADGSGSSDFVALRLQGTNCNRDAIGARVEINLKNTSAGRSVQTLCSGDGFISQSSKWLHFGLGKDPEIEGATVHWPGGRSERFTWILPGQRYHLVQGTGVAAVWTGPHRPQDKLTASRQKPKKPLGMVRVPLSSRFPMPLLRYADLDDHDTRTIQDLEKPLLINLWASWCLPCRAELKELTKHENELRAADLDVVAISVDGIAQDSQTTAAEAQDLLKKMKFPFRSGLATGELLDKVQIVQDILFARHQPVAVPLSLLLDHQGRLCFIYRGRVGVEQLLNDVAELNVSPRRRRDLAAPFPGRWYSAPYGMNLRAAALRFKNDYAEDTIGYLEMGIKQHEARRKRGEQSAQELAFLNDQQAGIHNDLAVVLQSQGNLSQAINHYQRSVKIKPDHVEVRYNLALALTAQEKFDQAASHLRQLLQLRPEHAPAHNSLGYVRWKQEQVAEAVNHYRESLRLQPDNPIGHYNIGLALKTQGKLQEAIIHYRKALQIQEEYADAHHNLGVALEATGKPEEANQHYRKAIKSDPGHAEAHNNLGITLASQGKMDEAIAYFLKAVKAKPGFARAYYNLGLAFRAKGKLQEAIGHLRQALASQAEHAGAHYQLGRALFELGRHDDEALQHLEQAVRLKPNWPAALNAMAWTLATRPQARPQQAARAIELAEHACELTENRNPGMLDTLAVAYAAANQFDQAVQTALQAIDRAEQSQTPKMAEEIRTKLKLYRQGKRYIAPPRDANHSQPGSQ